MDRTLGMIVRSTASSALSDALRDGSSLPTGLPALALAPATEQENNVCRASRRRKVTLLGATVGLGLSSLGLRVALTRFHAQGWLSAKPDWRVLVFTFGMAMAAAVFFGFAPALQIARQRQRKTIVRQVLIAAQVAASCVLLIVAGLLVRASWPPPFHSLCFPAAAAFLFYPFRGHAVLPPW